MPANSIAPGFAKIFYTGTGNVIHTMTVGVNPDFDTIVGARLVQKDGSFIQFSNAIAALVAVLRPLVTNGVSFTYAELWSKATVDSNPVFRDFAEIGLAGSATGATIANAQLTMSYRDNVGGNGKLVLLDIARPVLNVVGRPPAYGDTAVAALAQYMVGSSSWIYSRSNSYPEIVARSLTKTNDALRKRNVLGQG